MVSLAAFAAGLVLVGLSELGDKTQLVVISLSTRHSRRAVLAGAVLAEILMTVVAVVIGLVLLAYVPVLWIQRASAVAFLAIGIFLLWRREKAEEPPPAMDDRKAFASTFALVAMGEVGDKTQLAIIALAGSTGAPAEVLVGACIGLALMMGLAVAIGDRLPRYLKEDTVRLIGAALFVVAGALLLVESFL